MTDTTPFSVIVLVALCSVTVTSVLFVGWEHQQTPLLTIEASNDAQPSISQSAAHFQDELARIRAENAKLRAELSQGDPQQTRDCDGGIPTSPSNPRTSLSPSKVQQMGMSKLAVVQADRDAAVVFMAAKSKEGAKILDLGGANEGSLRYATHVIDKDADSAWYAKNGPSVIVARGDITKRLPYADKFFDYVWTSHVAEHMPDPQHFCGEISRITKVGGVFCVPTELSDQWFSNGAMKYDHLWWWRSNATAPGSLIYTKRLQILPAKDTGRLWPHAGVLRTYFSAAWERCFFFTTPLHCKQVQPEFTDWRKAQNVLPLVKADGMAEPVVNIAPV